MPVLPEVFGAVVARAPDALALIEPGGRKVSFAELDARAGAFAAKLHARGLRKGDRVLVALPVTAELYVALAAIWRLGLVAVFPEPALGLRGLLHAVRTVRPRALVASGVYRFLGCLPQLWRTATVVPGRPPVMTGKILPAVALVPEDPALISFTSGTSGVPKAILRSHGFLMAQNAAVMPLLGDNPAPRDLVGFPVFVLANLAAGRCSVLPNWRLTGQDRADPEAVRRWIMESGANRLLLPPSLCEKLAPGGLPKTVDAVYTGGGPVFPDVLRRLREVRPDMKIVAVYGSTEAEPIAEVDVDEIADKDWAAMASGAGLLAGRPVAGIEMWLRDGEILVAGAHVNCGYMDPADNPGNKLRERERVWHRTGDAARLDESGRLWLLGRWRENPGNGPMPFQIETAARFWPGVRRAALVRQVRGEAVLALEGDVGRIEDWRERAWGLGVRRVVHVGRIPLDRRHASKVDEKRLRRML